MSRSLSRRQAILLGFVVLTGIVLGAVGLFTVGSRQWDPDAFHVLVKFDNADGVGVGTRVHVQGMEAGEVIGREWPKDRGGQILFQLRLTGECRGLICRNSTARIVSRSLLSGKVIAIDTPEAGGGPYAEGDVLAGLSGDDLASQVARAAGLDKVSRQLEGLIGETQLIVQDFRNEKGPLGNAAREINTASSKLNGVLVRADDVLNNLQDGQGTLGKLYKDDQLYYDIQGLVAAGTNLVGDIREGKGTFGQLFANREMYAEILKSVQNANRMMESAKKSSDAIKALPIVRSYVVDLNKELNRPHCKRYRMFFPAEKLFEPGTSVLTDRGKKTLDDAAQWLNDRKDEGSEVVVAAFAEDDPKGDYALRMTEKQSEAVVEYLRGSHDVHRVGWWWWSNRTVKALGCGNAPSPVPEEENLPPSRVELIVFVPVHE